MVAVRGASLQTVQKHASVGWSWLGRPDVAQGFYLTRLAVALLWLPGPGEDGTAALLTQRAFSVAWLNLSISNFCVSGIAAFQRGRCTGLTGIRQRFSKQAARAALWFRRWWGDCHPACAEGECMKKVRHPLVWAISDSESLALQLQLYFFFSFVYWEQFTLAGYCVAPSSSSWVVYVQFGCLVLPGNSTGKNNSVWPGFHRTQKVILQAWNYAVNQGFRFVVGFFSLKQLIIWKQRERYIICLKQ